MGTGSSPESQLAFLAAVVVVEEYMGSQESQIDLECSGTSVVKRIVSVTVDIIYLHVKSATINAT